MDFRDPQIAEPLSSIATFLITNTPAMSGEDPGEPVELVGLYEGYLQTVRALPKGQSRPGQTEEPYSLPINGSPIC